MPLLAAEWPLLRASVSDAAPPRDSCPHERLERAKLMVPLLIERVGRKKWEHAVNLATSGTKCSLASPTLLISRAYFKMKEISLTCGMDRARKSLHLGEAPGGFVQAIAAHALPDWTWHAVTLDAVGAPKPDVRALPEGGQFLDQLPFSGDLLTPECRDAVVSRVGLVDLVTADGAVAMDHSRLEEEHIALLQAETDTALRCLERGGAYVCKFFEGCDSRTQTWIAKLTTRFEGVSIVKPTWSRQTNSERYIVCRGFEGNAAPIDATVGAASAPWTAELIRVLHKECEAQADALERTFRVLDQYSGAGPK